MTKKKGVVYKKKNKIKNYIERIVERKSSLVTKLKMGNGNFVCKKINYILA